MLLGNAPLDCADGVEWGRGVHAEFDNKGRGGEAKCSGRHRLAGSVLVVLSAVTEEDGVDRVERSVGH